MLLAAGALAAWPAALRAPGERRGAACLAVILVLAVLTRSAGAAAGGWPSAWRSAPPRGAGGPGRCGARGCAAVAWGAWAAARARRSPRECGTCSVPTADGSPPRCWAPRRPSSHGLPATRGRHWRPVSVAPASRAQGGMALGRGRARSRSWRWSAWRRLARTFPPLTWIILAYVGHASGVALRGPPAGGTAASLVGRG